ncbi:MAG: hypothetical protein N2485_08420 [bacterium]|nr:hypothetical protein [bacterium]
MYVIISLAVAIAVYVSTFNSDFKKEDIEKAVPFIAISCMVLLILTILTSIGG